jgi:hypothetical protein
MDILFAPDAFYLDRLLFKPIFDSEIETDIPLNSFTIREGGLQSSIAALGCRRNGAL